MSGTGTEVSIVGVGLHPFGRHDANLTGMAMGAQATRLALADAGVSWADIGYAVGGSNVSGKPDTLVSVLGLTGVPFVNVRNGCATAGVALATAANAIRAGETDLALVVGFDKHARGAFAASPADYGHASWYAETGLMITTQFFAMKDRRYLHTHGLKDQLLAQVAAKAFRCGELNPDAWRRTPISEDEIMRARVINPPLTQYMICSPSEGAAAVVLARGDRAADLCERPVRLAAVAKRTRRFGSFEVFAPWLPAEAGPSPSVDAARAVFAAAGVGPLDVQVAQLQDTDAGAEIYHMAETGLCEDGAQQQLIDLGETSPTGRLPINTDGGCLANGEPVGASGLRQVIDIALQLQGRAGARQVPRQPQVGFTHVYGAPGISACTILTTLGELMSEPEMQAWRAEVRAWLASALPRRSEQPEGAADYAVFQNITEEAERELLDKVREYRKQRFDAGYGAIALPGELGGAGLSMRYVVAFTEEEQAFAAPQSTELISVTCGLVGPTIATFGTAEQRAKYARAFLRSDLLCCQLFSEPGAGSDLAAVATSAVRVEGDGDMDGGWLLDGQKVWSSGARFADYGLLLARTDREVAKQAGLTMFLIPMDAPGVEVRPIRQMSGASSFNEVFLSGVQAGDDMRIGPVGEGWKVANATLGFERTASGQGTRRKGGSFEDLLRLATRLGKSGDPVVRQQLADVYVRTQLRAATTDRVARAAAAGALAGPAASIGKLVASQNLMRIGEVAAGLLGSRVAADSGEPDGFEWTEHILGAPGYRLAGGTDEIQRNIIGERVLGLPREPRVDKGVPFSKLPRSG